MFTLSLAFILCQPISVSAQEFSDASIKEADQVQEIICMLASLRASAMLEEDLDGTMDVLNNNVSETNSQIEMLEDRLSLLGVQEYTLEELQNEFGDSLSPNAYLPPTTSNVKWYMHGYNYIFEGVPYKVRLLYAQGLSSASILCGGADSKPMYSSRLDETLGNITTLASIYAQKIIGKVKVVEWTPYELLFSNSGTITDFQHYITYRYTITVCFAYVYPLSEGESAEEMTTVSSSVAIDCSHTFAGFLDGDPIVDTEDIENPYTENAVNFASKEWACKAYKYPSTDSSSFVSSISIYNKDGTRKVTENLATPNAWSLIY